MHQVSHSLTQEERSLNFHQKYPQLKKVISAYAEEVNRSSQSPEMLK